MGWWDAGVFGGDTPLDFLYAIEAAINWDRGKDEMGGLYPVNYLEPEERNKAKELIEKHWRKVLKLIDAQGHRKSNIEYRYIMTQVIAGVIMATGAKMSKAFKKKAIEAAQKDFWANEGDEERQTRMKELEAAIVKYDGSIVNLENKGLMAKIAEVLSPED